MSNITKEEMLKKAMLLLKNSKFPITKKEMSLAEVNDFGLKNLDEEGFVLIDLLRTDFVRMNLIILLPNQTLPMHKHPLYNGSKGKEETIRVLYGNTKIYVEGECNNSKIIIPKNKNSYYSARHEIALEKGEQFSIPPNIMHWFQAGSEGSVNLAFQNRVDENQNIFYDPESIGCKISNQNLK